MKNNLNILFGLFLAITSLTGCVNNSPTHVPPPVTFPDGGKGNIVFASNRSGSLQIYSMSYDGYHTTRLTYGFSSCADPKISPDRSKIAFDAGIDGSADIYVMNTNGSNPINITNSPSFLKGEPAWSPDGSKLAFVTNNSGIFQIYVINSDGNDLTNLSNDTSHSDYLPAWSPDGQKIAFESNRVGKHQIYIMDSNGANQTNITQTSSSDGSPAWSPDGSNIAFNL